MLFLNNMPSYYLVHKVVIIMYDCNQKYNVIKLLPIFAVQTSSASDEIIYRRIKRRGGVTTTGIHCNVAATYVDLPTSQKGDRI